jgi:hypothetical protein
VNIVYIIAIQGSHGAELTSGDCMYTTYAEAEAVLKQRHEDGSTYLKIFTLRSGPTLLDYQQWAVSRKAREEAGGDK